MRSVYQGLLALSLFLTACSTPDSASTYRVERRAFSHQVTAEGVLKAETTTPLSVPPQVQHTVRLAWVAEDGTVVEAGDLVARFDATAMQDQLEDGEADLKSARLQVDKLHVESDIKRGALETRLKTAGLELDHAQQFQKTDALVFSRNEITEDAIDEQLAVERREHASESHVTQESLSRTELELLGIQERRARQTIQQARDGLSALEVRAPHAGILTLTRNWRGEVPQVGSEMWRGQTIAEIPDLSTMEAEVFVLEADAGGLEAGKTAKVVVEARPDEIFEATVRRVDAVAKPQFRGSPVQYFGVTLAFEEQLAETMKPGQRVRATLRIEQVDDALVVPRQATLQEDGETRVLVASGNGFEPRRIETGASSLGLVEVTSGLAEGDLIALAPPSAGSDSENGTATAAMAMPETR